MERVRPSIFILQEFSPPQPPFFKDDLIPTFVITVCACCHKEFPYEPFGWSGKLEDWSQPVSWLKRIDPLDQNEKDRITIEEIDDALRLLWGKPKEIA